MASYRNQTHHHRDKWYQQLSVFDILYTSFRRRCVFDADLRKGGAIGTYSEPTKIFKSSIFLRQFPVGTLRCDLKRDVERANKVFQLLH